MWLAVEMTHNSFKCKMRLYQQTIINHWRWQTVTTSGQEKLPNRLSNKGKVLYVRSRKTKGTNAEPWGPAVSKKEVGRVWEEQGPPWRPELQPERDHRDLLPLYVMSPHNSLKLPPVPHIYRKHPPTGRQKIIIYRVFCFLYIENNIWVCDGGPENKERGPLRYYKGWTRALSADVFSKMRARFSALFAFQRKVAAQRSFSTCRPRMDETALWHTLSGPPVSGPRGSSEQRTGYCKSKQRSRWGSQAGCQSESTEIPPSHCYTQPRK